MRNLYRVSHTKHNLPGFDPTGEGIHAFAVDQSTDHRFYFAWEDGVVGCTADTTDERCYPLFEQLLPRNAGYMCIIAIEHLVLNDELCLASRGGDVWLYNLATRHAEEVTRCENGIKAMQWSPDQELVVFVDHQLNVVTMIGSEFEPINEVQLKDDTFGDRQFMSVGWGKKETQFHGSAGKSAAKMPDPSDGDATATKVDPENGPNSTVYISWRADGEFFAVGYMAPFGQRAFKVFNKEGALQYTSEKCCGLQASLAWRPSGQWIAVAQEQGDRCDIVLFEKNGLRHRDFPLPVNPLLGQHVYELHWSPDSEVLAVYWEDERQVSYVHLYVIGNYHWYLKQCLTYGENLCILFLQWDPKHSAGKTLHVLTLEDRYECIRFDFRVDRSVGYGTEEDDAMVAVIDGNRLLLSGFRHAVIPPPMCSLSLEAAHPINAVGFIRAPGRWLSTGEDISTNAFFTVDSLGELTLYDVVFNGNTGTVKPLLTIDPFPRLEEDTHLHWLWLNTDHLVFSRNGNCSVFYIQPSENRRQRHQDFSVNEIMEGVSYQPIPLETHADDVVGCIEASGTDRVLVQLSSGQIMEVEGFTFDKGIRCEKMAREHSVLPTFCEQLHVDRLHPERTVFAFAPNRRTLYRNGSLLASDVTSALLTEAYLLCTTISELKFIRLGAAFTTSRDPFVGERRLERGSKLVTVVPRASRTVLQLPRGNLEAINPRVLSLCLIAKRLDALEYYEAFDIMRKERINLNLLVDHDPARFLEHLGSHFLAQITNWNWLNLFITDLANQDACRTYASNYPDRDEGRSVWDVSGCPLDEKVRFCCERLLAAMDPEPSTMTLPKITCHVKQGQLEQALALIWTLKERLSLVNAAEEALRYLLYLVEVNQLYDVALGMYDFGLVLFVASKSQKDPKEYLPFLNELKRMEEDYRKYRIDCHLKRFDRALGHIARYETDEDRFREALDLIVNHQLYTVALRLYRGSSNQDHYRRVCALYGDYLRKAGKHADASLMYERAGDVQQAIASARHALDWHRVVRFSTGGPLPADTVLRSLVPALVEAGEYDAAATIAHEHLKDTRLAIDCLLKDHRYERALVLASEPDLQETVRTNVADYLSELETTLVSEKELFLHQKQRLALVREARLTKRSSGVEDADGDADCGDCDLFSDSSTIASSRHTTTSGRSGKSHRSSKNRRKHERKLHNLKEGNPFEDIALVDALHSTVVRVCGVDRQRHVRTVCQAAMELRYDDEAQRLQQEYGSLFQLIRHSLDAIWIPEMIVQGSPPGSGGRIAASGEESDGSSVMEATILTPADLVQAEDAQRYALIKPHQRYKPEIQCIPWQWDVLK